MGSPLEKELKYALSAKSHARLVAELAGRTPKMIRQHNVYFDDPGLALRRQRFGLRIRLVDDQRAILAVKYPPPVAEESKLVSFKVRLELEAPVELKLARQVIAEQVPIAELTVDPLNKIREVFSAETVAQLRPIGELHTERTVVPFGDQHVLELDACRVLDRVFFELEVETEQPEETDRRVRELLAAHRIAYRPLRRSKLARVFTTVRDQQRHLQGKKPRPASRVKK